jgi:hypothetical protein
MTQDRKYPHKEISDYETELFLSRFHDLFYENINSIVITTNNTTRNEVKEHLINSILQYLGKK